MAVSSARQSEILEGLNRIKINFGKDPLSRKTPDYIQKRLESLDNLWGEFEQNHLKLSEFPEREPQYFSSNLYQQGKGLYQSIRTLLTAFSSEEKGTQSNPEATELLAQQRTNFRSFNRLVRSINVDNISERWELEDELRAIQAKWNTIDTLHLRIDHILQCGDVAYENEFSMFECSYKEIKRSLNKKISSMVHVQQATPKLEIPTFTGKYTQWPTFCDLFTEAIHDNNTITKGQKMQHLKGKLKGEAERLIQHLHISSENYDTAWEILNHRYNNAQVLFTNQIEIFLNQPSISKQTAYELKRLYDTTTECIHAIHNLGVNTNTWDPLLVHLLSKKLDQETYCDYKEARSSPRELPSLTEFMTFLENKFTALEPLHRRERETAKPAFKRESGQHRDKSANHGNQYKKHYHVVATQGPDCPICNIRHAIFRCRKFTKLTPGDKLALVTKSQYCKNCLNYHPDSECTSTRRCKKCNSDHNTLLHDACVSQLQAAATTSDTVQPSPGQHNVNHVAADNEEILLTTLSLTVLSKDGTYVTLRALLDQGSQISLISENATQMLGLQRRQYHASISGVGPVAKQSKGIVTLDCKSIYGDYILQTQALVVSKVINSLPNSSFRKQSWSHLQHLQLADPEYNISKPIDLLLDASVYSEIILSGLIKGPAHAPIAQQTKMGWILSGNVKRFNCHVAINNIEEIAKFWELEDIHDSSSSSVTIGDQFCEDFYKNTTRRLNNGMYEVGIPMMPDFEQQLGSSKFKAIAQFKQLESKMTKNTSFSNQYKQFMNEYQELGHMRQVQSTTDQSYYLPHHGVWKLDSTTTKLRVVFNASSKTTSGKSLNDLMYSGPNLQQDLFALIINWRQHQYVITADIEKMFRQILVREQDQPLQTIIWRDSRDDQLSQYHLTTVTYGTKAAPFLAMRTLKQLATNDADTYPLAAAAVRSSFYMDDLLSGQNTLEQAKELQQQLITMFQGAGMNLRKWSSNKPELLQNLTTEKLHSPYECKCLESRKTFGLKWIPSSDTFIIQNPIISNNNAVITKRQLLSEVSKIFDPLGWLSPLTIKAKLLFQQTWSIETNWDQELPTDMQEYWHKLKQDLTCIDKFRIPRYLGNIENNCQLHAFCDASDKAYACVIYLVTKNNKGDHTSTIVAAKTKLAPVANKTSLPRLELCGALLLSQLVKKVTESLPNINMKLHAWTDSMIVLGWLHGDLSRWKSFVANRVKQITNIVPAEFWSHVSSEENAADCATRGITSHQLLNQSLWWEGPIWLKGCERKDAERIVYQSPTIETKVCVNAALVENNVTFITDLLQNYSSLTRIVRITGWVSRFIMRIRDKQIATHSFLDSSEINNACHLIIKEVQSQVFQQELQQIKCKQHVSSKSKICSLSPWLDENGLLRVGGRLKHASISTSAKHPIILPSHSRLTDLVINQAHITTLHGGPRLTLAYIRDKYWIISGIRTVKRQLRLCVKCRRFNNEAQQQIMADLPRARVTPSRPFTHTGVDFTGHVELKVNKGRGIKTTKGYVAVFVCLSTKAVHLELVSDLTTAAFLAAFRRFCSRRGSPGNMYSDNGTNFVGANRILLKEYKEIIQNINSDFFNKISEQNIQWHFNAPAWPNAGGLWEAAVKSLKYHLKRVIGDQRLTYEEFSTLLCQIEACLNSRPLCQLTENSDDDCLTPGHFLTGAPILSRPITDPESSTLKARWQLVQAMTKNIWKRWSSEYLQQLQTRTKWQQARRNLAIDDFVLIREENVPPGKWAMGRVHILHPGKDGYVRVVTVKTRNNTIQRPVNKLVYLPVNEEIPIPKPLYQGESSTPQTDKTEGKRRTSRPPRQNALQTLFISVLLMLFFASPSLQQKGTTFNVTQITTSQTLYFDKMSNLQVIKDDWKLIVYYNMSTFYDGVWDIKNYIKHLKQTADCMGPQYDSVILQLEHEVRELEHFQKLLETPNARRQKRGLINGVGYLANTLFGVLDDNFAQQYKQDIEKIASNENHLQTLLKNQTLVLESEYNILRRSEETMNKQFKFIKQHLKNVTDDINKVRLDNRNTIYVTSTALAASIILSNLMRIQHTLINTVTDISHGRIDPYLLTPEQLARQINIISGQLQGNLMTPIESSNLSELYKLMKASATLYDGYLIIEIKIPLVSNDIFELDKIIPIPQKRGSNQVRTVPSSPYIAYNIQKDFALLLSDSDLQSCFHIVSNNRLLCSIEKPVYNLGIKQSLCDIKTVSNVRSACKQDVSTCHNYWVNLHNSNSWLYTCCESCEIRISCIADSTTTVIRGSGIIDLGQGCTLKSDSYSIHTHNNYLHYMNVRSNIEVPEVSILNSLINTTLPNDFDVPENHTHMWNQLRDQITNLKEQSSTQLNVHDIHHYSVVYVTLALVLIVGGIGLYFILRSKCRAASELQQREMLEVRAPAGEGAPRAEARAGPTGSGSTECARETVPVPVISEFSDISESTKSVNKGTSPMVKY